jgi:hypothetical protein
MFCTFSEMLWKKPGQFFVWQMGREFLHFRTEAMYFFMHILAGFSNPSSGRPYPVPWKRP